MTTGPDLSQDRLQDRFTITGTGLDLSREQLELLALAEELGRKFGRRAARYDQEASFPFENYDDMREAGLLKLCVPKSHGGLGADLFTYALVSATLGKYCGATALTFNMHACSSLWPGLLADALDMSAAQRAEHEKYRALHFRRIVEEGAVYAQPFSEGTAAAAGRAPFGTTAAKVDGGWLLNGKKIFASLSGAADYYGVLCTEARPGSEAPSMRDSLYIAVPKDAPGFSIVGDWDPAGHARHRFAHAAAQGRVRRRQRADDAARRLPPGRHRAGRTCSPRSRPPTWASRSRPTNSPCATCAARSKAWARR